MIGYQRVQIAQNLVKQYDWIFDAYENEGISLADGFQKDGIQNSAGARKVDSWKNWSCSISLQSNKKGKFLIIEDSGTQGLTGKNLPISEIQKKTDEGHEFPQEMRLARFSSMYNSGGNKTGGGLFGVGKSIYSVASDTYEYYFDSLRDDGIYVASSNFKGKLLPKALEGDVAKKYIFDETGLAPLLTTGTRITIINPKKELVDAIENGEMVSHIQQTWWKIISRMDNTSAIIVNGNKVELLKYPVAENSFELPNVETYAPGYRVKHMGLYVLEKESEEFNGIFYYRKGMRIGKIDLKEVPTKLQKKIWGHIEVDNDWEDELAKIENSIHYGVQKGKKLQTQYAMLKNYINEKLRILLVEWGYVKDKENEDKKLREELQKIAEEVQDLFETLKFDDLGKGPKKPDYDVRWQDVVYPHAPSEEVSTGDKIKFDFKIKSGYAIKKTFKYTLKVINAFDNSVVSTIKDDQVALDAKKEHTENVTFDVNKQSAAKGSKNVFELRVSVDGKKEKLKLLPFYYDASEPEGRKEILLTLNSCRFPREGSLRLNSGEKLSEVIYKVHNKKNDKLKFKVNISIHNAVDPSMTKIQDVVSLENEVAAFEEREIEVGDIIFDKDVLSRFLDKGLLELRARLICAEDNSEYEKGTKVTTYHQKIYYNCDEKSGKAESFEIKTVDAHDKFQRSYLEIGSIRIIYINSAHPAYLAIKDDNEMQRVYLKEQVLKQYTLLYLNERKFKMFDENFEELDQITATDKVIDKIEQIYFESLKG